MTDPDPEDAMPFYSRRFDLAATPPEPPRSRAARRIVALTWTVSVVGLAVAGDAVRADATKPIAPDRVHQLTCGHLGVECVETTKRSSKRTKAQGRVKSRRARAPRGS